MPKLMRQDWERLKNEYYVAFWTMPSDLFTLLLDKVYGPQREGKPGSNPANTGELDHIDKLMFYLAHAHGALARGEPGIQPTPVPKSGRSEPGIQPTPAAK